MNGGQSAESDAGRMETLRDECVRDDVTWTIEAHDDQPIADGKKHAADLRVLVLLNGERVREFLYPSYRIWTLLAHWTEGIDALMAELATVTSPAESAVERCRRLHGLEPGYVMGCDECESIIPPTDGPDA